MTYSAEDLARNLIREFLIKNNLLQTLDAFNKEDPRQRVKMTKIDLIRHLSMERLIKNNKGKDVPFNSMLEVLADYLNSKFHNRQKDTSNFSSTMPSSNLNDIHSSKYSLDPDNNSNIHSLSNTLTAPPTQQMVSSTPVNAQKSSDIENQAFQNHSQLPPTTTKQNNNKYTKPQLKANNFTVESDSEQPHQQNNSNNNYNNNSNYIAQQYTPTSSNTSKPNKKNALSNDENYLNHNNNNSYQDNFNKTTNSIGKTDSFPKKQTSSIEIQQNKELQNKNESENNNNLSNKFQIDKVDQNDSEAINVNKNRFQKRGKNRGQNMDLLFEEAEKHIDKISNDIEQKKPSSFMEQNNKQKDELDEFDNMFGGKQQEQQNDFNVSNTKKIWEEDESYQVKQENQIVQKQVQLETLDYVQLDLLKPGSLSFETNYPQIDFYKQVGLKSLGKRNIVTIDGQQQNSVKTLLFAQSQVKSLPGSWSQGFIFRTDDPEKYYGLLQKEGGPCGVIASIQAYYLKWLFFVAAKNQERTKEFFSDQVLKENCLLAALADILWKCSDKQTIKLAVIQQAVGQGKVAGIEHCGQVILKVNSMEKLYDMMYGYKEEYLGEYSNGVATFLYSVVLTKGVDLIRKEFDMEYNGLIGEHGHCSQEGVNLLLTGSANSNVFDGIKNLDEMILKGINNKSEIGFLTIHEHYNYVQVGDNLKTPYYPIWVICKEFHYSVVFGKDSRCNENIAKKFDIIYYDELYNTEDRLLLTLTPQNENDSSNLNIFGKKKNQEQEEDEDMTPMLELVLRTKWGKKLKVDWNDSTVIL